VAQGRADEISKQQEQKAQTTTSAVLSLKGYKRLRVTGYTPNHVNGADAWKLVGFERTPEEDPGTQ
jgi:hypothetical protein